MRVKIYTKTGDAGETGLFGGGRVPKDHRRVEAYGQVDELNAAIGLARALEPPGVGAGLLQTIQRDLFTIGAELATPDRDKLHKALARSGAPLGESNVAALEDGRGGRPGRAGVRTPFQSRAPEAASSDILTARGPRAGLPGLVGGPSPAARYAVITDSHVAQLYGEAVVTRLRGGTLPADL